MQLTPQFEKTLRSYALGDLEEGLRAELEEMLITDVEAFEALGVIEDELIEDYLEGACSAAERESFERHFLVSPERSRRMALVRALKDRAARPALARAARASTVKAWQPAWIGLAATLALSLGGNVWQASRPRGPEVAVATAPPQVLRPDPPSTIAAPPATIEAPARPAVTAPRQGRQAQLERPRTPVLSLALAAGLLRAGGSLPRVTVPADALLLELRLELPGNDYTFYRAALQDADGNEIWAASRLRAARGRTEIALPVPAALLPRGDYKVKLVGMSDGGEPEGVASYAFRVNVP